jgi:DNA-binding HxlR family transcriptional regulator
MAKSLSDLHCSVARSLDVIGERWTLLVLRDAFNGLSKFDEFAESLPIARNILASRLKTLVDHDVLARELYQEHPPRYQYRLTAKGAALYPVLIGLFNWGDEFLAGKGGPPVKFNHRNCDAHAAGEAAHPEAVVLCSGCGAPLGPRDVRRDSIRGSGPHETSTPR